METGPSLIKHRGPPFPIPPQWTRPYPGITFPVVLALVIPRGVIGLSALDQAAEAARGRRSNSMENKKTSPLVYIVLIAVIAALGVFSFRRIRQNAEDRKTIDQTLKEADRLR
jgi:uncharacterized membrane protein